MELESGLVLKVVLELDVEVEFKTDQLLSYVCAEGSTRQRWEEVYVLPEDDLQDVRAQRLRYQAASGVDHRSAYSAFLTLLFFLSFLASAANFNISVQLLSEKLKSEHSTDCSGFGPNGIL